MTQYSFKKGLIKTVTSLILVGAPLLLNALPEAWMNLTVGAVLTLGFNYLKVRLSQ
jgi:hypothetical protein